MDADRVEPELKNINRRLDSVEQILPTLATREEIHAAIQAAIAPLATNEELREAVARLATKEELREAVVRLATKEELRAAVALLATKEELRAAIAPLPTREEMHKAIAEEGEHSRQYARLLFEDLRDDNRIILEHLVHLSERVDAMSRR